MNISVILAHPDEKSFNHAIAAAAADTLRGRGHDVRLHDLYREGFDPVLPKNEVAKNAALDSELDAHCREVVGADGIVIVHPNWWGMPPAIMKGWIDRVIRPGVAYEFMEKDNGEGVPVGLLKARAAVVFNTSNTPEGRELEVFGDPLDTIWKNCVFKLCGVDEIHRRNFGVIVTSTKQQRSEWLKEASGLVDSVFIGRAGDGR